MIEFQIYNLMHLFYTAHSRQHKPCSLSDMLIKGVMAVKLKRQTKNYNLSL